MQRNQYEVNNANVNKTIEELLNAVWVGDIDATSNLIETNDNLFTVSDDVDNLVNLLMRIAGETYHTHSTNSTNHPVFARRIMCVDIVCSKILSTSERFANKFQEFKIHYKEKYKVEYNHTGYRAMESMINELKDEREQMERKFVAKVDEIVLAVRDENLDKINELIESPDESNLFKVALKQVLYNYLIKDVVEVNITDKQLAATVALFKAVNILEDDTHIVSRLIEELPKCENQNTLMNITETSLTNQSIINAMQQLKPKLLEDFITSLTRAGHISVISKIVELGVISEYFITDTIINKLNNHEIIKVKDQIAPLINKYIDNNMASNNIALCYWMANHFIELKILPESVAKVLEHPSLDFNKELESYKYKLINWAAKNGNSKVFMKLYDKLVPDNKQRKELFDLAEENKHQNICEIIVAKENWPKYKDLFMAGRDKNSYLVKGLPFEILQLINQKCVEVMISPNNIGLFNTNLNASLELENLNDKRQELISNILRKVADYLFYEKKDCNKSSDVGYNRGASLEKILENESLSDFFKINATYAILKERKNGELLEYIKKSVSEVTINKYRDKLTKDPSFHENLIGLIHEIKNPDFFSSCNEKALIDAVNQYGKQPENGFMTSMRNFFS